MTAPAAFNCKVPRRSRSARPAPAQPQPHEEAVVAPRIAGGGGDSGRAAPDARAPVVPTREDAVAAAAARCEEPKPSRRRSRAGDRPAARNEKKRKRSAAEKEPAAQSPVAFTTMIGKEAPSLSRSGAVEESPAERVEKERRRNGKMVVTDESPPRTSACRGGGGGGGGKLMGDAIRSQASAAAAMQRGRAAKSKKRKDPRSLFWVGIGGEGQSTSSAGSDMDVSLDAIAVASDRLRAALRYLGVTPVRVYGKMLSASDRVKQQSRLLMSCKSWLTAGVSTFPLDWALTEGEKAAARGAGLLVLALDRAGEAYELNCKYLDSNTGYRLIGHWSDFLKANGLVVKTGQGRRRPEVMLDLWLFRSPGGRIGLVVMHYRKGDAPHADAALEEYSQKRRRIGLDDDDAEAASAEHDVAAMQVGGGLDMEDGVVATQDGGTGSSGHDDDIVTEDANGVEKEKEEETGAPGDVAAAAPSSVSEADGAKAALAEEEAGAVVEAETPSASDAEGAKAAAEEEAGATAEAAAPSSTWDAEGAKVEERQAGAQDEVAAAPSSSPDAGGLQEVVVAVALVEAAVPLSSPDADGVAAAEAGAHEQSEVVAAAVLWRGNTREELEAARALLMLSRGLGKFT